MTNGPDRRQFKRIAYNAPVEYIIGEERGFGQLVNVSMGGIRINTPFPLLKKGQTARVVFVLNGEPFEVEVNCRFAAIGFGIGAEFINLTPAQSARLSQFSADEPG